MAESGGQPIGMDDVSLSPNEREHRGGYSDEEDEAARTGYRERADESVDADDEVDGSEGREDSYGGFLKARIDKE